MQNRYVGDIGDYAKYSLLRALVKVRNGKCDRKLGVSWYLFPDESGGDGGRVGYLLAPERWREPDPAVFDTLRCLVGNVLVGMQERSVAAIEESGLLPQATFWSCPTVPPGCKGGLALKEYRERWFELSMAHLMDCDIVFADPDNGLRKRTSFGPGQCKSGKGICEDEALRLAANGPTDRRPVVVYHHNTMFPGGHDAEVQHWLARLTRKDGRGHPSACAIRWRLGSSCTFFILNCDDELRQRAKRWCERWERPDRVYLQELHQDHIEE